MATIDKITDLAAVNETVLYCETLGNGPMLLLIAGSTGDAGNFTRAADLLADEFTVVTYDRRGNSRSPRPSGWKTTSVAEQADDAAALIRALDLAPAAIFGASAGGPIALDLMIRHPELVRAGVLQEPTIFSALPDPMVALAPRRALIEQTLAHIAEDLVAHGVRRLVVAGGETAGAVVSRLGVRSLLIGAEIDPGVPWTYAEGGSTPLMMALKSGNFGGRDFFTRAFEVLP